MSNATTTAPLVPLDVLVGVIQAQQLVTYVAVVSAALLVYEIIINMSDEIEYIWKGKLSFVTVLYIIQRYLPLFDTAGFEIYNDAAANVSAQTCSWSISLTAWSITVGIMLSEIILTLRVWAVWSRRMPATIGLCVLFLACWIPSFTETARFLATLRYADPPFHNFIGCFLTSGEPIIVSVSWIMLMVFEAVLFLMIMVPAFNAYRQGGKSKLLKAIYQDGAIYYALLLAISTANVTAVRTLPGITFLLFPLQRVLHSVMTSRAVLHMREIAKNDNIVYYSQTISDFEAE